MKNKKIILVLTISLIFSACSIDKVKEDADKLLEDSKTSYENIEKEVKEVQTNLEESKAKIDETIKDVQNATTKIKETKEALRQITE